VSTRVKTLLKAVIWELISAAVALVVTYWWLGSMEQATELTIILFMVKATLLYFYERLWK
jgi:uncharacterized membrane protein